jgi:hypothetical protein
MAGAVALLTIVCLGEATDRELTCFGAASKRLSVRFKAELEARRVVFIAPFRVLRPEVAQVICQLPLGDAAVVPRGWSSLLTKTEYSVQAILGCLRAFQDQSQHSLAPSFEWSRGDTC